MSVIDRVKAHFEEFDRKSIEVPEWGENGKPLIVTWTPMTIRQHRKCYPPGNDYGDPVNAVNILIVKAEDENGNKLFNESDRAVLENKADRKVIGRVVSAILGTLPVVGDEEKN